MLFFSLARLTAHTGGPVARFTFNNRDSSDEVSGRKARLAGTMFVEDRFGNSNHAVLLSGNLYSYINLGSYEALKPDSGSISLWVDIENVILSGIGSKYNPLILTKYSKLDDFYEAYAIYYMYESERLVAVFTRDSLRESGLFTRKKFERNRWHHIVLTYSYEGGALYLDGELQMQLPKRFATTFLPGDSVMVGHTANTKNSRYLNGVVDDIEFYDRVLTAKEVLTLYQAPNPNRNTLILNVMLFVIAGLAILVLLYFLIKYRLKREVVKEKQQLELTNKILETDLRVNRALMNPHFVFNSLNSLQNFILSRDYLQANGYLVKFSKLMRKILDSNAHSTISLEQEIELLTTYLELEDVRFEKSIDFSIETEPGISPSTLHIPVMLLQPFVENAIWHGLLNKPGRRELQISFSRPGSDYLLCIIEDNGVGRQKANPNGSEKKSLATLFVTQRLDLLNKIHHLNCSLTILDKLDGQGTVVKITLPILTKTL